MVKLLRVVLAIAIVALIVLGIRAYMAPAGSVEPEVPAMAGKINIEEVCRGSLAYTTFMDNESAEAYVEACINGEHPDVIERYKSDMGLGDGAAI